MSKSIHTTYRDLTGLTKKEIDEQQIEPDSDLSNLAKKSVLKKEVKTDRKNQKNNN